MADGSAPLRFGVLTHAAGDCDFRSVLRETVELAVLAEQLGFDSFWVAQHHLGAQGGHVPSPLVVLAAVAAQTEWIRLGTAVVVAPLEDPLRLAEDAATVDALSGGRLELGLGAGADPETARAFGRDHERRHADLVGVLDRLLELAGQPELVPRFPALRDRLWIGTSSASGMRIAAERGLGVLSGRSSGPEGPNDKAVAEFLAEYRRAAAAPRVGLSRPIVPAPSLAAAHALLRPHIERWVEVGRTLARYPRDYTADEHLARGNVHAGDPAAVAAGLLADPGLPHASHLLCHVQPARLTLAQLRPILTMLATAVRPLLSGSGGGMETAATRGDRCALPASGRAGNAGIRG
ncbi:LLM class flavin-dependent oxidoreductase [Pseudonocardia sp. H11422]|uniref:LLM class flavin-dependent oxidoreductase n=1 Tax=Pseudonocardia sp. H11422 TaxID=2835866 RepID=UPI001BDC3666|nr:LLM class flavin-dependent oxidoreductase [Pseudonocardia sp. H11422]